MYFVDAQDLKRIPCQTYGGGFGCGPPRKLYHPDHLLQLALAKHGREVLTKKQAARAKRADNKRKKEEDAQRALQQISDNRLLLQQQQQQQQQPPSKRTKTSNGGLTAAAMDTPFLKKLRASLLRLAKKDLKFRDSGAPDGWKVVVPATSQETFAALIGRPEDATSLATCVKKGAYYSESVDARDLFGGGGKKTTKTPSLEKYFRREMVSIRIVNNVVVKYKPSTMDLIVIGDGEITLD